MSIFYKIIKHKKDGKLFFLIKEKIQLAFYNFIIKNKDVSLNALQCKNYRKLKRKFKKILDEDIIVENKSKSNIIWFCWLQGYNNAPNLVKACYNSIKKSMPEKEIIFLTEDNISEYVDFSDYINYKYKKGIIGKAHYSDLVRISVLCKYGGTWIDSTVLCTSSEFADYITNLPLFAFKQIELNNKDIHPIVASNWLISSESNNEICLLTQKLLFEYWKKYNYALDYFIFHFFFSMACEKYFEIWKNVPTFNNINPHILQFELNNDYNKKRWKQITNLSGFHKLNHHNKYVEKDSMYSNIIKTYLEKKGEINHE